MTTHQKNSVSHDSLLSGGFRGGRWRRLIEEDSFGFETSRAAGASVRFGSVGEPGGVQVEEGRRFSVSQKKKKKKTSSSR